MRTVSNSKQTLYNQNAHTNCILVTYTNILLHLTMSNVNSFINCSCYFEKKVFNKKDKQYGFIKIFKATQNSKKTNKFNQLS